MNPLTPWLVCLAFLVMVASVFYVALKTQNANKKEIKRLTEELEAQKKNSEELCEYIKKNADIKSDKEKVAQKIKEAENNEEVMAIIAGLVHANNNSVRK